MDSWINREIGQRYLVREFLGAGAHARVYRATDAFRGQEIALKHFHSGALDVEAAEAARDAQRAEALRQSQVWEGPSILPILEIHPEFLEGEVTVMPLMDETLADLDPIFGSQALHYTRRVLTALDFCHGRGVVHGDIKPSNIFLDSRRAAFLGDFGVRDFLPGGGRGYTLEYAAPELLPGGARSAASDVWATAVMLYQLLTGELPFGSRDEDREEVVADRIAAGECRHPDAIRPYLPLRVRDFFRACLEPDPSKRKIMTADRMHGALSDLGIRAEWIQWRKPEFVTYWEGFQVASGKKTGVRYSASVRERPGLGCWEAEVKRAQPGGGFRRWKGVGPYRGTKKEAVHRMTLWMKSVTQGGAP